MSVRRRNRLLGGLMLLLGMTMCHPAQELPPGVQMPNVLFLYSFNDTFPWEWRFKKGLHYALLHDVTASLRLYEETLDASRFEGEAYHKALKDFFKRKYAALPFSLVVAENGPASEFLLDYPGLWGDASRLVVDPCLRVKRRIRTNHTAALLSIPEEPAESLRQLIRVFHPRKVVVVGESKTEIARDVVHQLRTQVKKRFEGVEIDYLLDRPIRQLQNRLARLPEGTAVFYALIFEDGKGRHYTPYQAVQLLAQTSSAPIFSHWDSLLGSGIAGGYMISSEEEGKLIGQEVMRIVRGEKVHSIEKNRLPYRHIYDWRILKRYNFSPRNFPAGSIVLHKPTSVWERYRTEFFVLAIFLSIATTLVFCLATLRRSFLRRGGEPSDM